MVHIRLQIQFIVNPRLLIVFAINTAMLNIAFAYDPVFQHQSLLTHNLSRGIYGDDDRKEYYELNSEVRAATRSIPALIFKQELTRQGDSYRIQPISAGAKYHLCQDETFYTQPAAAYCSGFIIGPDLIATAGHCVVEDIQTKKPYPAGGPCENIAIVFDYRLNYKGEKPLQFPAENVFHCKKVISRKFDNAVLKDYAVFQVDRPFKNRPAFSLRTEGQVKIGNSMTTIGYPLGMPVKVVGGATVRSNDQQGYFTTDLDTFHGNSGGPVLDTASLISGEPRVEGILVRGPEDLLLDTDDLCYKTNICGVQDAMHRTCWGEQVSRIDFISRNNKMVHTRPTQPNRQALTIKTKAANMQLFEELKIELQIPQEGYLTILEVNPEGDYTVLFPNKHEPDNRVKAGNFTVTNSPDWKIQVTSGPFGFHQLYAILSEIPDNLYQQNKSNSGEVFAKASIQNLSSLSRGAKAVPRMKKVCGDNPENIDLCSNKPKVASTRVCYYQYSHTECR